MAQSRAIPGKNSKERPNFIFKIVINKERKKENYGTRRVID